MTLARERLAEIAAWIAASSAQRRTPLGGETDIGPWAVIVAADFSEPPSPQFEEGALPIFVPAEQCEGIALPPIITVAPPSRGRMGDRLGSLLWRIEEGTLPPAALIGLTDPAEPILEAVERAGAVGTDLLAALPLLTVPLWPLPPAYRSEIDRRLPMLR